MADKIGNHDSSEAVGSLQQFALVAEQVASTTKKLEKAALVGTYLKALNDADLTRAARYFAGHQFAQNDARTTNVGGSIIRYRPKLRHGRYSAGVGAHLRAARRCR